MDSWSRPGRGGLVAPRERRRVLIADDDRELRSLLAMVLTADGVEVSLACDGHELIEIARAAAREDGALPDVILADLRMPGVSGLAAIEQLAPLLGRTELLVMTAFADDEVLGEALRLGAVGVLAKPFELDDLRSLIFNAGMRPSREPGGAHS